MRKTSFKLLGAIGLLLALSTVPPRNRTIPTGRCG